MSDATRNKQIVCVRWNRKRRAGRYKNQRACDEYTYLGIQIINTRRREKEMDELN